MQHHSSRRYPDLFTAFADVVLALPSQLANTWWVAMSRSRWSEAVALRGLFQLNYHG